MNRELVNLQGQIERVTYTSEETGYTVARVKVYGRRELVTITGSIVNPTPGEIIRMKGEWENHPKYGEQFKIVFCETAIPANVHGIEKYLGSGLIKGIGPVMAKRIVAEFKEKTLEVIEHEIDRITDVEGIGQKRICMIKKAWDEQKEIREVMIFLQSHGVSSGYAAKIFKEYGRDSIGVVKDNPYRLATDIFGIGFVTADKIAEKLGFAKDSEKRAAAGILYTLQELSDEGHVYYPYELLIEKCKAMLCIDRETVIEAIGAAALANRIVIEDLNRDFGAPCENQKAVYLAGYHFAEKNLASRLKTLITAPQESKKIDSDRAIQWVQEKLSFRLAEKQVDAVRQSLMSKVMVITGGPGTGKTTIINAILKIFAAKQMKILLTAPTGRAAKRMSESTNYEAKTIHRVLEFNFKKGGFQRNEKFLLDCHLLIIDEVSMIDTVLMHHLIKAVPPEATLIMVGDVNQLPSVGAGNVLKDIIDSGTIPVVQLHEIFRQAKESSIITNAHSINEGIVPNLEFRRYGLDDFYFIEQGDPEKVVEMIIDMVKLRIPRRFGFDSMDDIQVVTPMHKGTAGAANLNVKLQEALNPGQKEISRGGRLYRINDKIMQVVNNYKKEVYNGDIGRIVSICEEENEIIVSIDGRTVVYEYSDLDELIHAYAVSIHKSQGSEYPAVIIPVLGQHYILLQRNLLYTGVTRGKKLVVIVGTKKAFTMAVKNNKTQKRFTLLKKRLMEC
ncbi:MAG: ATP-dependent RecD-like DNA helicase [Syntrophales bacterium]|jgi:exodeoxyribonuclease V alpha subunit|nr:ATP-dependent RecD-like DNA helicase [Syntrophales bacterium]MDY0045437.1 ATP-dependent RecD-like DNA helicase [Syntrophales bacterium]